MTTQLTFRTEEELRAGIVELARLLGYLHYHTHRSQHSPSGFPDDLFLRANRGIGFGPRLIVAELKLHPASQKRGRPTEAQKEWLDAFELFGFVVRSLGTESSYWPRVEAYVWRPADWFDGSVEQVLRG